MLGVGILRATAEAQKGQCCPGGAENQLSTGFPEIGEMLDSSVGVCAALWRHLVALWCITMDVREGWVKSSVVPENSPICKSKKNK